MIRVTRENVVVKGIRVKWAPVVKKDVQDQRVTRVIKAIRVKRAIRVIKVIKVIVEIRVTRDNPEQLVPKEMLDRWDQWDPKA